MKRFGWLALAAVLTAGPALAYTQEEIEDWARTAVNPGEDEFLGTTVEGVTLITANSITTLPNGHRQISTRFEFHDTVDYAGFPYRSLAQTYEIDCQARLVQHSRRIAYSENNLRGRAREEHLPQPWTGFPPGSGVEFLYHRVCDTQSAESAR